MTLILVPDFVGPQLNLPRSISRYCQVVLEGRGTSIFNAMKQQSLPIEFFLKGFADSAAINFHQFSKKCLATMKTILQNQESRKNHQKSRLLEECRIKIKEQRRMQAPQAGNTSLQSQDSRIARINRIKEAMESKKNEGEEVKKWTERDLEMVFKHFGQQLKVKILQKYPHALDKKMQEVIHQKWNAIDPVKKEYYIAKALAKIKSGQVLLPKQTQNNTEQPPEEPQELNEIKREEDPPTEEEPENRFSQYLSRVKSKEQRNEEPNILTDETAPEKLADEAEPAEGEVPSCRDDMGSPLPSQELKLERKICNKAEEMSKIQENDE